MSPDDYIASVSVTAGLYAPANTALCQGQIMSIQQNVALFALVGATYGGNAQSTFGLPNLAGGTPFGAGAQPGTGLDWDLGETTPTLTQTAWPSGNPAAVTQGATPTVPVHTGPSGLALNWAITLQGIFPPRP